MFHLSHQNFRQKSQMMYETKPNIFGLSNENRIALLLWLSISNYNYVRVFDLCLHKR